MEQTDKMVSQKDTSTFPVEVEKMEIFDASTDERNVENNEQNVKLGDQVNVMKLEDNSDDVAFTDTCTKVHTIILKYWMINCLLHIYIGTSRIYSCGAV